MSQSQEGQDPDAPPNAPGWVKVLAITAVLLVLLFIILHLAGVAPMGH